MISSVYFQELTQLFFFISLLSVSSSLLLLPMEGKAELSAACTLDFLEGIEKSCTSLRSMAPALDADLSISVMFILGKLLWKEGNNLMMLIVIIYIYIYLYLSYLDDRSMGAPIEGGGVFNAGTAGLLNCPED